MPRSDVNNKELKEGDRVIIIAKNGADYGDSCSRDFFQDKKVYGVIADEKEHENWCCGSKTSLVTFKDSSKMFGEQNTAVQMRSVALQKLEPEQYAEYEKYALEADVEADMVIKGLQTLRELKPSRQSFMDRTFNFDDRVVLDTGMNFVVMGAWNRKDNIFHDHEVNYLPECCAFTQATRDMEVYIPDIWLRYYGWTIYDLGEWLKFLAKCEIGFEYEYRGLGKLGAPFIGRASEKAELYSAFTIGDYASVMYPAGIDEDQFHCIRVKGSEDYMYQTYIRFIALRYMYNHKYWTIPGHAMQIKRALGAEVTHWQALLFAHLYRKYHGYYAFGVESDLDATKPYTFSTWSKFGNGNNYDRHLDPFQSAEQVMTNLKDPRGSMNTSFEYVCDTFKREELRKFFDSKDYIGLFNYAKEKVADEKSWRIKKEK